MCDKTLLVPIPDFLRASFQYIFDEKKYGEHQEFDVDPEGRQCFALDACIVPAVETLWAAGIRTTGCCCGHGSGHGMISVEVPNGGDVERRDKQIQGFYERVSKNQGLPLHQFRGSKFDEGRAHTVYEAKVTLENGDELYARTEANNRQQAKRSFDRMITVPMLIDRVDFRSVRAVRDTHPAKSGDSPPQ